MKAYKAYINIDERYGGQENCCIDDYRELNPDGIFYEDGDGIYEDVNGARVKIADPTPAAAAAAAEVIAITGK